MSGHWQCTSEQRVMESIYSMQHSDVKQQRTKFQKLFGTEEVDNVLLTLDSFDLFAFPAALDSPLPLRSTARSVLCYVMLEF